MEINIRVISEDLAEGQTVGQYLAEKFGSGVLDPVPVPAPHRDDDSDFPSTTLEERQAELEEVDTSLEDDANDAAAAVEAAARAYGDPTKPPMIPAVPPAAAPTTTTAAEATSAPATQTAAEVVVPPAAAPAAVAGVEVDSAGVPWNAEIHSGNKKKYGSGSGAAKNGRWNWKRGTDEVEREAKAQQLAADLRAATPAVPAAAPAVATPAAPAPTLATTVANPVVGSVANPIGPAATPVPENAAPAAAPAPTVAAPAPLSALGWNWANFLEAMTAYGAGADIVLSHAAQYQITTIPELSPRVDVLEAIAVALGWPAPVAAV